MCDFKGIWIPAAVWLEKELSLIEKFFIVQIKHLDNKDGCFASNSYFSEFFSLSRSRCTQIIKSLETKKFISVHLQYEGKVITKRVLNLLNRGIELFKEGIKFSKLGYLENCEENNTNTSILKEKECVDAQENFDAFTSKNQNSEEKEKSCAKKEKRTNGFPTMEEFEAKTPTHQIEFKAHYELTLSKFKFPESWSDSLKQAFLTYCSAMDEKRLGKWGSVTQIKLHISDIKGYLTKYESEIIEDSLLYAAKNGNTNYNPQWIINRKEKERQDEKQSNNRQPKSKFGKFGTSYQTNGN